MINEIIQAISIALDDELNKNSDVYEIYTEEIKQGLKEPCFFIQCIAPTKSVFLGKRYKVTNQFCVQYFPTAGKEQSECNNMIETLTDTLEYITAGTGLIRASSMHGEIVEQVLHFFVNYDFFTYKDAPAEALMRNLSSEIGMR